MQIHEHILLVNFAVTTSALLLTYEVLRRYFRPAMAARRSGDKSAVSDMIIGVPLLLVGIFAERLYWMPPWIMAMIGDPDTEKWFKFGVLVDLPVRQVTWVASAFFLLRGILGSDVRGQEVLNNILRRAFLIGIVVWVALLIVMNYH